MLKCNTIWNELNQKKYTLARYKSSKSPYLCGVVCCSARRHSRTVPYIRMMPQHTPRVVNLRVNMIWKFKDLSDERMRACTRANAHKADLCARFWYAVALLLWVWWWWLYCTYNAAYTPWRDAICGRVRLCPAPWAEKSNQCVTFIMKWRTPCLMKARVGLANGKDARNGSVVHVFLWWSIETVMPVATRY